MVHYPSLKELVRTLGGDYCAKVIDLEKCLYRDFGNGFNVEVSGVSRANHRGTATLYLWFGDQPLSCMIVKTKYGVGRAAEEIHEAVEELREYSEQLLAAGYTDRDSLWKLKNNI